MNQFVGPFSLPGTRAQFSLSEKLADTSGYFRVGKILSAMCRLAASSGTAQLRGWSIVRLY